MPMWKQLKASNCIAALTGQSGLPRSCDNKEKTIFQFVSGLLLVSYGKESYQKRAGNFFVLGLKISFLRTRSLALIMLSGSISLRTRYIIGIFNVLQPRMCQ